MISREICQRVLRKAVSTGADYAEIFAQNTTDHSINMIANKVDAIRDTVISGAAVRVYKGLRSVMASTVDTSETGLLRCAEQAAEALGQGTAQIDIVLKERIFPNAHPVTVVPSSCTNKEKVSILKDAYFAAREYDACIAQVTGVLMDVDHNILVANTDGIYTQDRQIRTRLAVSAVADKGMGTQTGSCSPGRRMGLEMFDEISHFFEVYKALEHKHTAVKEVLGREDAIRIVKEALIRYDECFEDGKLKEVKEDGKLKVVKNDKQGKSST